MTKIKFFKKQDMFCGYELSGHTGYADNGEDILCSAISSLTQGVALGITKVCNIRATIVRDEDNGYLKVELPKTINDNELQKVQVLFETLYISIKDLMVGYSNYISMEVIGNVY